MKSTSSKLIQAFFLGNLVLASLAASSAANAALPLQKKVGDFELGMSAEKAMEMLSKNYPGCEIVRRNHKDENGDITEILTEFAVDAGDLDKITNQLKCEHEALAVDRVNLKFVNPDYIASQPLYEITYRRAFADPAQVDDKSKVSFDEIKKSLFAKYGKPSGQLRAKTTSVNDVESRSKAKKAKAPLNEDESYNVAFVWGGPGLKAQLFSFCMEKCGGYFMTADMTIMRKKDQPKNAFYVQTLAIRMTDTTLDAKQYDWIYERIKRIRNKSKVF